MNKNVKNLTSDEKKSLMSVQKFASIDETDVNSTNTDYKYYLNIAVGNYIESLMFESESEMNSSTMFRLFSLWSSNSSDMEVFKDIEENHKRIPTFKFIPLMTQITTHLSTDGMKKLIEEIIGEFYLERSCVKTVNFKNMVSFHLVRCASEHPHHVLPKVLALVNAFKDDEFIQGTMNKTTVSCSPRTDAAVKLLQVMKGRPQLRDIIVQMERMFEGKIILSINLNISY